MRSIWRAAALSALVASTTPLHAQSAASGRVQLTLDASEAESALAIMAARQAGRPVTEEQWQKLFGTAPYRRLQQREQAISAQFHDPSILVSDSGFKAFIVSDSLVAKAPALGQTLLQWERADLRRSAERVLAYLPAGAVIHARVYPMVKPRRNSFVWDLGTDPTIFLFLDPAVSAAKFENTVAHELHHIGLASLGPEYDRRIATLPPAAHEAAQWMGAFGEGLAMLAAAGGPDVDPHAASTPEEHARWTSELARFDADLPRVDSFFVDVLAGRISGDSADARASAFFGSHQGPWYTVGYGMAVRVERQFGRPALIATMTDFRCLLALYNRVAVAETRAGRPLPLWSDAVVTGVQADRCPAAAARP